MKINSSVAANSYLLDAVTNNIDQCISVRSSSLHSVRSIIMRLMMVMMIVGGWNVVKGQSTTGTITFGNTSGATYINSTNVTGNDNLGNTWTITTAGNSPYFGTETTFAHIGSNNSPATSITFTTTLPSSQTITSLSAKFGGYSGTAGTITLKVGNTSVGIGSLNAANDVTVTSNSAAAGNVLTVTVTGISKGVKAYYISYTYSSGPITYSVTYNANGATSGTVPTDNISYSSGAPVTVLGNTGNLAKTGYTFSGWNTAADGTGTDRAVGSTFNITSNTTLYAKWAPDQYSVTWYVNGALIRTRTYDYGSSIPEGDVPADPTSGDCNGKTFIGWSATEFPETDDEPTLATVAGATVNGEKNYYAVFAEASGGGPNEYSLYSGALTEGDYVIYYGGKAMNTTVTSNRLQYEEVSPVSNTITTTEESIVWHIAPSGNYWTIYNAALGKYAAATNNNNQAQMLNSGTDDKALWSVSGTATYDFVNKSNSRYLRNNGTYGFACYASSTGSALSLYKRTFFYSAYSTSCVPPTSATVYYYANGGSGSTASQTVDIGEDVIVRENGFTAPTGYHFLEWNTANNGTGTSYMPGDTYESLMSNVRLYAIWEKIYTMSNGTLMEIWYKTKVMNTTLQF